MFPISYFDCICFLVTPHGPSTHCIVFGRLEKEIHKTLFSDIYDFAGQIRTCDISKDNFHFAHFRFLEPSADYAIKEFKEGKSIDSCIDLYAYMNVLHPFMEGNGRATRFWFDLVLQQEFNK